MMSESKKGNKNPQRQKLITTMTDTTDHQQQLHKIARSINDATREAYDAMVSSKSTIVGDIFGGGNKENNTINNDVVENNDNNVMSSSSEDNNDNRAGMEMGIALFGTSDSYKNQMEEEFREKLSALEKELGDIREGLCSLNREVEKSNKKDGDQVVVAMLENESDNFAGDNDNEEDASEMIPQLQNHVKFLQQCSQAKNILDNVEKLSFSNFATHNNNSIDSSSSGGNDDVLNNNYSSSSMFILSPRVSFGPTAAGGGDDTAKNGKSPMVQAAHLVKEADGILESATQTLQEQFTTTTTGSSSKLTQVQAKILNELQLDARRFRSELKHRASILIERCVVVEEGKLLIKGSGTANASRKSKSEVGADVDDMKPSSGDTTKGGVSTTSSPLSDAYEVLDTFSDAKFPTFGKTLDITMKKMVQKIMNVFKARMVTFESAMKSGKVAMFTTREETVNKTRKIGDEHDFANVGSGASVQLLWTMTMVDYEEQMMGNDDDDVSSSQTSTNTVLDEKMLQSAPSLQIATFLSLLNYLINLFEFIFQHVLLGRPEFSKILGKQLFQAASSIHGSSIPAGVINVFQGDEGVVMTDIVEVMRKWCIPVGSSPRVWKVIKSVEPRLVQEVGIFEGALARMGFLNGNSGGSPPIDSSATLPLSKLASSLSQAYVEAQRCQIINAGRNILFNTDYHNTTSVGHTVKDPAQPGTLESLSDDPHSVFLFHKCSVSVVAQEILQLCRKTLDDASNEEAATIIDTLPSSLYRASREVLDLFRAIIPTRHGKEIASLPRIAAVLHNDCVYLAHETSFLGAEYKERFSKLAASTEESSKMKSLSEVCTFIDMVPPFRDLASKSMGSMIETQKVQLHQLVSPRLATFTEALGSNEPVSEWDDAETALKAALHHLQHLSQVWKTVLSRHVYHITMGNLVDTAFIMFLETVLKAEEISEPASRFVHYLFIEAVKSSKEVFRTDEIGAEGLSEIASKNAVEFGKLEAVGLFMVMRLDDIERGLEEGTFRCLKAKELSKLISAAFDESDKRRRLLNLLTSR